MDTPSSSSSSLSCPVQANLEHLRQSHKPIPTVYVDLDGTLCATEMHHAVYYFICNLPSTSQRLWKLFLYFPMLAIVGPASIFSEGATVKLLAWLALSSVRREDAEIAGEAVADHLLQFARPELLAALREHQAAGHQIAILSGNAQPIIAPFCHRIGAVCLSSHIAVAATAAAAAANNTIKHTRYTGSLIGSPMIGSLKSKLLQHLQVERSKNTNNNHSHVIVGSHKMPGVYGYGNSKNDRAFLDLVEHPHAVTPDSKLHKYAKTIGWPDRFHSVAESHHVIHQTRTMQLGLIWALFILGIGSSKTA